MSFLPHRLSLLPNGSNMKVCEICPALQVQQLTLSLETTSSVAPRQSRPHTPNSTMRQTSTTIVCPGETSISPTPVPQEEETSASTPSIVQCGLYAAEMLCGSLGALHSISLLIVGMLMWLLFVSQKNVHFSCHRRCSRNCIRRSTGSHPVAGHQFSEGFAKFFVLLFALQRLELKKWNLNSNLNGQVLYTKCTNFIATATACMRRPNGVWRSRISCSISMGRMCCILL